MDTTVMAAAAGGMVFGVGAAVIFLNSRFATERSAKIAAEAALKPLQDQLASVQKEKQQPSVNSKFILRRTQTCTLQEFAQVKLHQVVKKKLEKKLLWVD